MIKGQELEQLRTRGEHFTKGIRKYTYMRIYKMVFSENHLDSNFRRFHRFYEAVRSSEFITGIYFL